MKVSNYNIVKSLLRTEKSSLQEPLNKYLFLVANNANKLQIKKAIEEIYKVKVHSVNTINMPGKLKRVRYQEGYTSDWKKALVSLKEGSKIEVT
ncbi:MAG: 50S ribosomal protein L23 [Candidatus Omnitrophota bacterium]